ncbi:unnamed protein product [Cylindrotheca closterium]|uniref:Mitochondrial carrier protein n=1 Tax=Cylindrotheca closterium TaxID=2856 RepID=A0AAD2FIP9_9STRA|nr:unnamed protein product [Cylindrotheca closterium]
MEHKQEVKHHDFKRGEDHIVHETEDTVSFFHDFVAGGIAGSASVVVGHPFDTLKVRMQTATQRVSLMSLATSYGGMGSLFRGMSAPLVSASFINATIFATYGWSSRVYDDYFQATSIQINSNVVDHDSTVKAFTCGSFAGLVQALIICPTEHVKCRLQTQTKGTGYKGPLQAARTIASGHGVGGLYRAWACTCWREIPAFGLYFSGYDWFKDKINAVFAEQAGIDESQAGNMNHAHAWAASTLSGGITGAVTWAVIYPFDIIKTRIQTAPLDTPLEKRRILTIARDIVQKHGVGHLFRGLNITIIRAFPVNGIIFPVYEYILMKIAELERD